MENSARVLIVEDEELAQQLLASYIGKTPYVELAGVCSDAAEALAFLREQSVDVVFLDVKMPEMSGMEFLRLLRSSASASPLPSAILTTAFTEYAVEGYELDVVDYLLKPFSFERYLQAVNKALQQRAVRQTADSNTELSGTLTVRDKHRELRIPLDAILFLRSYGNYTKVHTRERVFIAGESLKYFESTLPPRHFCRIHKGTIVARRYVERVEGNVLVVAGHELGIGITYKTLVASMLAGTMR